MCVEGWRRNWSNLRTVCVPFLSLASGPQSCLSSCEMPVLCMVFCLEWFEPFLPMSVIAEVSHLSHVDSHQEPHSRLFDVGLFCMAAKAKCGFHCMLQPYPFGCCLQVN